MIGCECETCTSDDHRDQRTRTGILIENNNQKLVIDISADFRQQALRSGITKLEALLITHCHADHVFGLDDIRPINFKYGAIPVYASSGTWQQLKRVFYYIFEARQAGGGLPQIIPYTIENFQPFETAGLKITAIPVIHGKSEVSAYRFDDGRAEFAFVTDCNRISEESLEALKGLDLLILDALRIKPHPTHLHLEQSLEYVEQVAPRRTLLTHLSHDLKHSEICKYLPTGVELAYDGLEVEI